MTGLGIADGLDSECQLIVERCYLAECLRVFGVLEHSSDFGVKKIRSWDEDVINGGFGVGLVLGIDPDGVRELDGRKL